MTRQQLTESRQQIIEKIIELGCESNMKQFMSIMLMDADFHTGSVEELVMSVYNTHYRTRSRQTNQVAEAQAKANHANGTYEYGNLNRNKL